MYLNFFQPQQWWDSNFCLLSLKIGHRLFSHWKFKMHRSQLPNKYWLVPKNHLYIAWELSWSINTDISGNSNNGAKDLMMGRYNLKLILQFFQWIVKDVHINFRQTPGFTYQYLKWTLPIYSPTAISSNGNRLRLCIYCRPCRYDLDFKIDRRKMEKNSVDFLLYVIYVSQTLYNVLH